jgi:hypothetical protein
MAACRQQPSQGSARRACSAPRAARRCSAPAAGFFGADCSLSLEQDGRPELLAGQGYHQASAGPLVYVYELPPEFNIQ